MPDGASTLLRAMRRELVRHGGRVVLAGALSVGAAALATLGAWLMIPLGALLAPETLHAMRAGTSGGRVLATVVDMFGSLTPGRVAFVLVAAYLTKNAVEYAARVSMDVLAADMERDIRRRSWTDLWNSPRVARRGRDRNPLAHALLADAREAAQAVAATPHRLLGDPLTAVGYVATMLWISPVLALVLLAAVPVGYPAVRRGLAGIARGADRSARARAKLGGRLSEILSIAPVVRGLGVTAWAREVTDPDERTSRDAAVEWSRRMRAAPTVAEGIGAALGAVVIWAGLREIAVSRLSGPEFLAFLTALFLLLPVVKRLAALGGDLSAAMSAWRRLESLGEGDGQASSRIPRAARSAPRVVLDGVSLDGDGVGTDYAVLRDVALSVPAGSLVAVVGPTGAGKSLLLEVVAGLARPTSGHLDTGEGAAGYVPQEGWAVSGTVVENIALGRDVGARAVRELLDELGLDDVAPETHLGEHGAPLSGGERQRVAIARALACDPTLIVLDEPTSALDDAAESLVVQALLRRAGSATVFVATHRAAFLSVADIVVRMGAGHVESIDDLRRADVSA